MSHFLPPDLPIVEPILKPNEKAYNPYPSLGAPDNSVWPRGFPIDLVQKPWDQQMPLPIVQSDAKRLGVLQSLADFQPDVDAIYRLTKKHHFCLKDHQSENCKVHISISLYFEFSFLSNLIQK